MPIPDMPAGIPVSFTSKDFISGLRRRYALTDVPSSSLTWPLFHSLVGITNVDEMLRDLKIETVTKDLQAAAGTFISHFLVPTGKHWRIVWIVTSGTTANSQLKAESAGVEIAYAAATTSPIYAPNIDIPLDSGDNIGRTTTGNAGDAARAMQIAYVETDMF